MKKLLFATTLALALACGNHSALAQAKKKPAAPDAAAPAAAAPAAAAPKPAAADPAKPKTDRPIPMNVRADEVDAAAKTITQVTKDGKKGKNTVTATTEIKNGDKEAKFEDIKVGDWVAGLRKKTGDNEYEVVKITKFGPKAEKAPAPKAPAPAPKPKAP